MSDHHLIATVRLSGQRDIGNQVTFLACYFKSYDNAFDIVTFTPPCGLTGLYHGVDFLAKLSNLLSKSTGFLAVLNAALGELDIFAVKPDWPFLEDYSLVYFGIDILPPGLTAEIDNHNYPVLNEIATCEVKTCVRCRHYSYLNTGCFFESGTLDQNSECRNGKFEEVV